MLSRGRTRISGTSSSSKTLLVIDDRPIVCRGIRQTLREEIRDLEFGVARTESETLSALSKRAWSLAILGSILPDRDRFALLQRIVTLVPQSRVLMLDRRFAPLREVSAIQLGAFGYIGTDGPLEHLVKAVRSILAGRPYFSASRPDRRARELQAVNSPPHMDLSPRELEVLLAVAAGRTVSSIASGLGLSIKTVSTFKRRTLNKLQLNSTPDLIRYVIENNLLQATQDVPAGRF
jgi:DNA-binding NarL/FixJ family response regulator